MFLRFWKCFPCINMWKRVVFQCFILSFWRLSCTFLLSTHHSFTFSFSVFCFVALASFISLHFSSPFPPTLLSLRFILFVCLASLSCLILSFTFFSFSLHYHSFIFFALPIFCLSISTAPFYSFHSPDFIPTFFHPSLSIPLSFSISSLHSLSGGMPPTPQAIQIGGQNQNQQQYDPSKGPPVQNAASLHTPPPQLPGRIPQATLPMATLPLALSQAQPVVLEQQCQVPGGQLQAQVKLQGAGAVLTAVNPHPHLQMQLQIQQQQTQPVMQPGQAVSKVLSSSEKIIIILF